MCSTTITIHQSCPFANTFQAVFLDYSPNTFLTLKSPQKSFFVDNLPIIILTLSFLLSFFPPKIIPVLFLCQEKAKGCPLISSLMAYTSTKPVLIPLIIFLICLSFSSTLALDKTSLTKVPASTISAAPALLPNPPLSSPPYPALSPDIAPLFPSPGGSELAPTDSSLPTIPSSPSPPNPDAMAAPGPFMPFHPSGTLPIHSAIPLASFFSAILVFGV